MPYCQYVRFVLYCLKEIMNTIEKFFWTIHSWIISPTPEPFGVFHLVTVAAIVALSLVLCLFFANAKKKTFRAIILTIWAIMLLFEIVKIVAFSVYEAEDGSAVWEPIWNMVPLQLCSTPLYTLPLIALLKDGKVRDAFVAFTATFTMFGGIAVMVYPFTVFSQRLFLSIQTMEHHGLQIVSSVYLVAYFRKRFSFRFFLRALPVFYGFVAIVLAYNFLAPLVTDQPINMFFMSPYHADEVFIVKDLVKVIPWGVVLVIFLLLFPVVAVSPVFFAEWGIIKLAEKGKKRSPSNPITH